MQGVFVRPLLVTALTFTLPVPPTVIPTASRGASWSFRQRRRPCCPTLIPLVPRSRASSSASVWPELSEDPLKYSTYAYEMAANFIVNTMTD
jgi:hypothetical protein